MERQHDYTASVVWTGNRGKGTAGYRMYDRTWDIITPGKPVIHCSNDPLLGGDPALPNPEDLLLASLSACHMLWYLHLASDAGIVVSGYRDDPIGIGETASNGAGRYLSATLRPQITIDDASKREKADSLHHEIHQFCFIARSVSFPVRYAAAYSIAGDGPDLLTETH